MLAATTDGARSPGFELRHEVVGADNRARELGAEAQEFPVVRHEAIRTARDGKR